MPEKIHYDDNIFFLNVLIRALRDGVKLHIDADYFADKILEDTLFVDATIQKIYRSLKENTHLIKRDSYIHSIMKLKKAYGRFVEDLLAVEGSFVELLEPLRAKLRRTAATHLHDAREIMETLAEVDRRSIDSDMISYDELHFLMIPMEDDQP